jgi:hypothetical protein
VKTNNVNQLSQPKGALRHCSNPPYPADCTQPQKPQYADAEQLGNSNTHADAADLHADAADLHAASKACMRAITLGLEFILSQTMTLPGPLIP